ncbi:nucleoside 2-deoxyribosyltransferase [Variovorax sp. KBW07]|nr:nucleoside 2-deoxyribosyltransferase [Variovorax sp. KBW07]
MPIARPCAYLAGPDVFRPDAAAHFEGLVQHVTHSNWKVCGQV